MGVMSEACRVGGGSAFPGFVRASCTPEEETGVLCDVSQRQEIRREHTRGKGEEEWLMVESLKEQQNGVE